MKNFARLRLKGQRVVLITCGYLKCVEHIFVSYIYKNINNLYLWLITINCRRNKHIDCLLKCKTVGELKKEAKLF